MAGEMSDGRSAPAPATATSVGGSALRVPTREQLRARWTCDCELLGLVAPRIPGSHKAVGFMCPQRRETGSGEWTSGQVFEVLVSAMPVTDAAEIPKSVHKVWELLEQPLVTFAMCLMARRRPNPAWSAPDEDASKADVKAVSKTLLVQDVWESWGLRHSDVRGLWGGWSGEAPKPETFRIRNFNSQLNITQVMKYVKTGAIE